MEYIPKPPESRPAALDQYADEWKKWQAYHQDETKKQPKGHWTHPDIREPLVKLFLACCGYCGQGTGKQDTHYEGQVDHYIPKGRKADSPKLVYDWTNYIWSCQPCNHEKGETYQPDCLPLNPCDTEDMAGIELDENSGCYQPNSGCSKARFELTRRITWVNEDSRADRRRKMVGLFRNCIKEMAQTYEMVVLKLESETVLHQQLAAFTDWLAFGFRPLARRLYTEHEALNKAYPFASLMDEYSD